MAISYTLIRSDRKTLSLQITPQGEVVLRCPRRYPRYRADAFVAGREEWIRKHLARIEAIPVTPVLTEQERAALISQGKCWFASRTAQLASALGISYGRITIRTQRTRWGSCSPEGNLNFNALLMLAPEPVRDYVIIHELCHRLEMNHSPAFWGRVEQFLPDYRIHKKWLKDNGPAIMSRL